MEWSLKRTVAPASDPVSVAEAKAQSRVLGTSEDTLIERLVAAAVDHIEGPYGIGVVLSEQTWELALDWFPLSIELPLYPVQSVTSIEYEDTAGVMQTVDSSVYRVDTHSNPARITLDFNQTWPTPQAVSNSVKVKFVAGHANGDVPQSLRHAIVLLAAHWFEHREAVALGTTATDMPMAVESLLARWRVPGVG